MSLIWMITAGVIAGVAAKLLMRNESAGGLFILAFGGSMIAGTIQYSEGQAINLIVPMIGAASLLVLYAIIPRPAQVEKSVRDDVRKAA
jgi:uncharacterized membrane protein YeaQ/YmgE (transglycosylase-associated protein family)